LVPSFFKGSGTWFRFGGAWWHGVKIFKNCPFKVTLAFKSFALRQQNTQIVILAPQLLSKRRGGLLFATVISSFAHFLLLMKKKKCSSSATL
jgi:hypothetical protein